MQSRKHLSKVIKFQNLVEKCCIVWKIIALESAIFLIVYGAEIVTIFKLKVVTISAYNTIIITKICELRKAIFSVFYNILPPNFRILLLLKGSFPEFRFFRSDLAGSEISL